MLSWAFAVRRSRSLFQAYTILREAEDSVPEEPLIDYDLACHEAQLGNLSAAREQMAEAIRLNPKFREMAAAEPDLKPLREAHK